jgi:S-adenosylmethionine decarboxylase proenzyme
MVIELEHAFSGTHVFGEFYGVDGHLLNDYDRLESALLAAIQKSGATVCNIQGKLFSPNGITILALLEESHASLHTYPEEGAVFFDVFTCGNKCNPLEAVEMLRAAFRPTEEKVKVNQRGRKKAKVLE